MPEGEACLYQTDDARDYAEEDVVDWHETVTIRAVIERFVPHPDSSDGEAKPAVHAGVDQKEEKGFVVFETDASGQPWAVMIHFQYAAFAAGTVMSAVWFSGLTFLAVAQFAGGLDGERCRIPVYGFLGGERRVAGGPILVEWRAGWGEDGCGVGPVEEGI